MQEALPRPLFPCRAAVMDGVKKIMVRLQRRSAGIKVLDKLGLNLTTPAGQRVLASLSGLAQQKREPRQ